ncbi:glycosyltransferase 1 domain-containing protein 1-like isoform X2 [Gigantopelta aegis]|nr:glycosyltransferase 1 domain-containing protein 1-like isoform X2 [Gigantopelta aegis]
MPHVVIVVPSLKSTKNGNFYTVDRIGNYLTDNGYTCLLVDPKSFSSKEEFQLFVETEGVDLVFGIHAYKSGCIFQDAGSGISVPYILMLGGTDINEYSKDPAQLEVMTKAVDGARHLVVFGTTMLLKTKELWPCYPSEHIKEIKQAVIVKPSLFSLFDYLTSNHLIKTSASSTLKIFLLVGGVRPVKDPVYLFDIFSEWHKQDDSVFLIVVGPKVDLQYCEEVFSPAVDSAYGVIYISELPLADVHAAIKESFALVNSSKSEGMSLAILEAMKLKTLVFVRDIPGNHDLVEDGYNGIVFNTPFEFHQKALSVLNNPDHRKKLISQGFEYVTKNHNPDDEQQAYLSFVHESLQC